MKRFLLFSSCFFISLFSVLAQTNIEHKQSNTDNPNQLFIKYTLPVYGINETNSKDKIVAEFYSKDGIMYAQIDAKTNYLTVFTKDYITYENVLDVLRIKGCKTDTYSSVKITQKDMDEVIKKQ